MPEGFSNSQVDKAGALLRTWWDNGRKQSEYNQNVQRSIVLLWQYRAAFNHPLLMVNVNLRHYVKKAGAEVVIAPTAQATAANGRKTRSPSEDENVTDAGCRWVPSRSA